ncbi:MAG: dienelactone hydrolase family protein [Sedimentisphaerales bacterium]|nr:dienelactone hydrolase family protein [Sedimentisphaerales bacterium]
MHHEIADLFKEYTDGLLNRRELFQKIALIAGGAAAAYSILSGLEATSAMAEIVPEGDPRLHTETVLYPGETGDMRAYWARPKGKEGLPSVIVIHENRGLNAHIKDVTRRMALEGFLAIAPDALSPFGGTPEDQTEMRARFSKLDNQGTVKNFVAAVKYLKTHPLTNGKVGCTGFCWGGGMTNQVAVNSPDLLAAVPYYGNQAATEEVPKIKASLLCHYGGLDTRINQGITAFEEALKQAKVDYKIYIYEGAAHAFNNDTNTTNYNKEAAELAWKRTIDFFKAKLQI